MVALLEHSDHRKAGRALAIVSTTYILLDQCTSAFETIGLLGLKVHLTREDLHWIFGWLCWLYLVVFLARIWPSLGLERLYKFHIAREHKRSEAQDGIYAIRKGRIKFGPTAQLHRFQLFARLTEFFRKNHPHFDHLASPLEYSKTGETYQDWAADKYGYISRKYAFLGYYDFALLWITEIIPPILFFAATWLPLQSKICSSFAG